MTQNIETTNATPNQQDAAVKPHAFRPPALGGAGPGPGLRLSEGNGRASGLALIGITMTSRLSTLEALPPGWALPPARRGAGAAVAKEADASEVSDLRRRGGGAQESPPVTARR
jgi:hypothetical protein